MSKTTRYPWLRFPPISVQLFLLPGVFLLAGGPFPPQPTPPMETCSSSPLAVLLSPSNWLGLLLRSVLICLPGWSIHAGADYLAEVRYWDLHVLRPTPPIIWKVVGYVVAILLAGFASCRL